MKQKLTISIVTFNNQDSIKKALDSIKHSTLTPTKVIVVDNSSSDGTAELVKSEFPEVTCITSPNIGFGSSHNTAINSILGTADYHLVMNPDIYFARDVLEKLVEFMDTHGDVGLVMPKILYPDNQLQYLCKLLPTPFDLMGRRFFPGFLKPLIQKRLHRYELRDKNYDQIMEVPHLSGCFMLLRTDVLKQVGLFDHRFFMYLEDVDLSRRIHTLNKTIYYPAVAVYHQYHKGSYKRWKHLKYHVQSAIKYFNKWGWYSDKERKAINRGILM